MQILETITNLSFTAQEWAFGLSLVISGLFLSEYRRCMLEQERQDMIDSFLNDKTT
jgi:hypothetical protein